MYSLHWFLRIKWILLVVIVIANWPTVTLKFLFVFSERNITSFNRELEIGSDKWAEIQIYPTKI